MNNIDIEVLRSAIDWQDRGHRVTLGTVVRTWGSAPRPPGSLMVIRDDGQVAGSLSGGCIEDDLIARVARGEIGAHLPTVTTYGATAEEAQRFGLPCGGTVQVVLEPLSARSLLRELLSAIEGHRLVARRLDVRTGVVQLGDAVDGDTLRFDGNVLAMHLDANSAVVALTHDPKLDDLAPMEALRTPAFYVGALGSRRNNDARRERLLQFEVSREESARLRGPVGLRLGGLTPPEIAVAIIAEMTAVRRGIDLNGPLANWSGSLTFCRTAA